MKKKTSRQGCGLPGDPFIVDLYWPKDVAFRDMVEEDLWRAVLVVGESIERGALMVTVEMELPEEMIAFAMPHDKQRQLVRNAMMLYPYIVEKKISHGRAAEILGIHKQDLIDLYGQLGFCYFDQIQDGLEQELQIFRELYRDPVLGMAERGRESV